MPEHTPPQTPIPPHLHHNWEDWLPYLTHSEASDAEKRVLIEAVWNIVVAFAELGWDVDTATVAPAKTSGKVIDLAAALQAAVLYSETPQQREEV
ncbi:hypothetical protein [Ascidiaceihabitans sp.]|uniref:hypothetical protein n=1 Tax=Ascidiaceihabitans sp. TaxID=1872644 RepID=UPI003298D19C